ncbi:hypothetical protein L6452_07777 [Arctium lappa]|uniref:Uncharacterized protein n=1 Tax=Arctium lappa TaxID=4217 RepID=A0ACB9EL55_ARCLA|nr:hypothetical protein L6452_07777 [Arctium lappa]
MRENVKDILVLGEFGINKMIEDVLVGSMMMTSTTAAAVNHRCRRRPLVSFTRRNFDELSLSNTVDFLE